MEPFTPPNIGVYTTKLSNSTCKFPEIWKEERQPTLDTFVLQKLNELEKQIKELKQQIKDLKSNDMDRKEIIKTIEYNAASEALKRGIERPESFEDGAVYGYEFAMSHTWKDAQGDDLPDYDREVVVLVQHVPEYSDSLRVSFGHRPNPKGYVVVKGEKLYARTYDKGWNQPNVRYWLDARLPYEKEEIKGNQGENSLNRIIGTEEHIKIALDVMEKGGEQ